MIRQFWPVLLLAAVVLTCTSVHGQDCSGEMSKRAEKLVEKATAASDMPLSERVELLKESVAESPQCMSCLYKLARAQYELASQQNSSYEPALQSLEKILKDCPHYSADAHYYAGIIAYGNQDYPEAVAYFESFLAFDPNSENVSRDHEQKVKDIAVVLPEARFYADFYSNPVPFEPRRLSGVSGEGDEYLPMLSPDNQSIFFTRKQMVQALGDLYPREVELFMRGERPQPEADFAAPQPLPPPFNVGDNYGGVSISLDNREMFVTVCKPTGAGYKNCDLYVTHFESFKDAQGKMDYKWSGLQSLGPEVNTPDGWEAQPTLSADGNTLYFSTIRPGTRADAAGNPTLDIYATQRQADNTWGKAASIGDVINTEGNDKSPFLHADSRTLYFATNGRIGAGGYDIYYSRQDAEGYWSSPKNIGYPINSPQDEHGLVVSTDGKDAIFASANVASSQGLDLYAFTMPKKARPQEVVFLKGEVRNDQGQVVPDARIQLKYTATKQVETIAVNADDGSYAAVVNLRKGGDVVLSVQSESKDLAFNSRLLTLEDSARSLRSLDLEVAPLRPGQSYEMHDIRYASNSSTINQASKHILDAFAAYMKAHPELQVEIGGHTDDVGDPQSNLVLSTDRAFEVFGYLQEQGVSASRMSFKGYGESKPLVANDSDLNRAKNRRTEFTIAEK